MKLDYHVNNTLDHSEMFSRQWGTVAYGGRFGTEPKPGDDSAKERAKEQRWKEYKTKWGKKKLGIDPVKQEKKVIAPFSCEETLMP